MRISQLAVGIIPIFVLQPAFADGPYYGGGLAVYSSESEDFPGAITSKDVYAAVGGTVGYRWDQATTFIAAELDGDVGFGSDFEAGGNACSSEAFGPYFCEHTTTVRLRGVVGAPLGAYEGFATAGLAMATGQVATDSNSTADGTNTGYTVGVGLQSPMGGGTVRYELIYDDLADVSSGPNSDVTLQSVSLKVSYLFN